MKLSNQVLKLVEDVAGELTEEQLHKFWKLFVEHIFKPSKDIIKKDWGFFLDGVTIKFDYVESNKEDGLDSNFYLKTKDYVLKSEFISEAPKDLVALILNELMLDVQSTRLQDEQAFDYLLKHLKNENIFFYGSQEVEDTKINYTGIVHINNFRYDHNSEKLIITDHDIKLIKAE